MISVSGLKKSYSGNIAVEDLSFEVEEGQVYGLLGPNGAGKSTTMNILTGYISATEGSVKIDGIDMFEEPEKAKAMIGYLPELPPVYPEMTVSEYLKFVCGLKRYRKRRWAQRLNMRLTSRGQRMSRRDSLEISPRDINRGSGWRRRFWEARRSSY